MKIRPLTLVLLVIMLGLLALFPAVLQYGLRTGYGRFAAPADRVYTGNLILWQIDGDAQSNTVIAQSCEDFETSNAHVFMQTTSMSADEAKKRMADGEYPDIISFDHSFGLPERAGAITPNKNAQTLPPAGERALPYIMDAYCLFVNEDILYANDLEAGDVPDYSASDILRAAALCQNGAENTYGIGGSLEALKYMEEKRDVVEGGTANVAPVEDAKARFMEGSLAFYVAPRTFAASLEAVSTVNWSCYALFGYTDLIRYVSVMETDDAAKYAMACKYANSLLDVKNQKRAVQKGFLPVRTEYETYVPIETIEDDVAAEAYLLLEEGTFAPPPGE